MRSRLLATCLILVTATPTAHAQTNRPTDDIDISSQPVAKRVAGIIEQVAFLNWDLRLNAKLDTGAKTSALNARGIKYFNRGRGKFVTFEITDRSGKRFKITRPLAGFVKIRRAGVKTAKRPLIKLKICLGGITAETRFTLANRSNLSYQALIGRSFLRSNFLVASGKTHLQKGRCS